MKLFPHQEQAYVQLRATAQAFFHKPWQDLPVRPRFNRLIVGPSGTGKTHLARYLAKDLCLPYLELCSTNWIPLGASERGARSTWSDVADFCYLHPDGIICLDEVDKLGQPTAWMTYLRVEMFCLLDRRCPANLRWRPEDARLDEDSDEDARAKVEMRLEGQMLIVGAGAFQDLWDVQRDSVGFHAKRGISASSRTLTHKRMSEVIPVEILNRFVPPVLAMPRLQESDYLAILKALSRGLIVQERPRLRRLAQRSLAAACEQGLGSRWAEQLLLELVSQGRAVPKAVSASASKQEDCSALPGEQQEAECALP